MQPHDFSTHGRSWPPASRRRIRAFRAEDGSNLAFTALRLGLAPVLAARLRGAAAPAVLPEDARRRLAARAELEGQRLSRLGRSRDPRYDLNRHLAVARLRRWLGGCGDAEPPLP
ncbi:hypothetical protein [Antarcticirhabdus aurantiaca]|uniref:Uncharacterized protein n=1 Tax=Antarcticirhabdus aurantiaca TaxID=2606717 RepID=A0ACD4NUC2_9HYPH|nr:hypothetical protein [Antarcticirhabdus aurantiaca]WAJ30192.1 hypothetical protein OXU80_08290 [Jeongeuplla avenae]